MHKNKFLCPIVFDGTCNKLSFKKYILYCCQSIKENGVIILDNARIHNVFSDNEVQETMQSKNIKVLFLPPYSPDLNDIEHGWGWLKYQIRKFISITQGTLTEAINYIFEKKRNFKWV